MHAAVETRSVNAKLRKGERPVDAADGGVEYEEEGDSDSSEDIGSDDWIVDESDLDDEDDDELSEDADEVRMGSHACHACMWTKLGGRMQGLGTLLRGSIATGHEGPRLAWSSHHISAHVNAYALASSQLPSSAHAYCSLDLKPGSSFGFCLLTRPFAISSAHSTSAARRLSTQPPVCMRVWISLCSPPRALSKSP